VDKLAELPFRHQDRFALLRISMVPRLVRLVHTGPRDRSGQQEMNLNATVLSTTTKRFSLALTTVRQGA
jgi:hypothetical protein